MADDPADRPLPLPAGADPATASRCCTRALAEAEARRRAAKPLVLPPEKGGPAGPEPVRYGDWERNGRAVDF
ncbi:hypothetical protein ruthe_03270 [Rubellimicrobium thermophilum DSM 16684]|uniref:Uncharacterized protein n=1 Tax=Rubellimicrobium thermophilum DSM 16684 TaxID=1123069 RepID=S9QSD8_9RHOB|nr:succinate dehydrogenase assembly factor 4 [Rubellimicrobium thermophilum]EPX82532.1 hypothetical protein ruthe_03270 [Rubellimicrobium thermophilum DSM 16684]